MGKKLSTIKRFGRDVLVGSMIIGAGTRGVQAEQRKPGYHLTEREIARRNAPDYIEKSKEVQRGPPSRQEVIDFIKKDSGGLMYIPGVVNDIYQNELNECLTKKIARGGKTRTNLDWQNGGSYFDYTLEIAKRFSLPIEIAGMILVESNFKVVKNPFLGEKVESRKGAAGVSQFIPETAKVFGLAINPDRFIDERYDVKKAIEAQAKYLCYLFDLFISKKNCSGDASLTIPEARILSIVAYNQGEGNVLRAMKKVNWDFDAYFEKTSKKGGEVCCYYPKTMARAHALLEKIYDIDLERKEMKRSGGEHKWVNVKLKSSR